MGDTTVKKAGRIFVSATACVFAMSLATQAYAFCFSNQSISNASFSVRQMPKSAFKESTQRMVEVSKCDLLPTTAKKKCWDLKKKAAKKGDEALKDFYEFMTDLPLVGDPIDDGIREADKQMKAIQKWGRKADKDVRKVIDEVLKPISARFNANVPADVTRCCNWKNKDCNPSGKKNGVIYFNIKYAGVSRIVRLNATDHMECRIHENNAGGSVCRNYVWPQSPYRAKEKTIRGMMIKSMHSDKCLGVERDFRRGQNVDLSDCHGGSTQRWTIYKDGIVRNDSHKSQCLEVQGAGKKGKSGQNVRMGDCLGDRNQRWIFADNAQIVNRARGSNNWCLEIQGGKKNSGANAQIWKCHKKNHTRWRVSQNVTYTQVLKDAYSGKCVDNTGGIKKGTRLHTWTCNKGNTNQQWLFKVVGKNYVEIKSRRSGLCLGVAEFSQRNGAKVVQWPCNRKANQRWEVRRINKDGWIRLQVLHSKKCLSLAKPSKKNRTLFEQKACNKNTKSQAFRAIN